MSEELIYLYREQSRLRCRLRDWGRIPGEFAQRQVEAHDRALDEIERRIAQLEGSVPRKQ